MDRLEAIREYLKPYKTRRLRERIEAAEAYCEDGLLTDVRGLLERAAEQQNSREWEPVCLCLLHLLSSIVTGSHDYLLLLANEELYLDDFQLTRDYRAAFLYTEPDPGLRAELQRRFIRLSEYELDYAEHWLQYETRKVMEVWWGQQIEKITELDVYKHLKKKTPFYFLYGEYMGTVKLVSIREEEY